jgi:hypothetical protein
MSRLSIPQIKARNGKTQISEDLIACWMIQVYLR